MTLPPAPDPSEQQARLHVSIVTLPEAFTSYVTGLYDVLTSFELISTFDSRVSDPTPFDVTIVGESSSPDSASPGLAYPPDRHIDEVDHTDIVIVGALAVQHARWETGRYPELVDWLARMHARGATLCSACSGVLLLAETGLLDDAEATIHWAYADTFRDNFPAVRLRQEEVLVASGDRSQFVMSGASAAWHDLVMYLIARYVGPTATLAVSNFMMLDWHRDGQSPYIVFQEVIDHGDAAILTTQQWLAEHYSVANPVEEMTLQSGLQERTFKRRFKKATGHSPLAYVQHVRVEAAKRQLESTGQSVDEISWQVGYEDVSFFRRLFKRLVGLTPGAYRKKFVLPHHALVG